MPIRIALLALALATLAGCQSNGLVVETVNNYGGNRDLPNSHADGDGFIAALTPADGNNEWRVLARWKDADVYDTDFLDNDTWDQSNFDQPGTAISFFSGHGLLVPYGENPSHRCSHSTECTSPPLRVSGQREARTIHTRVSVRDARPSGRWRRNAASGRLDHPHFGL